MLDPILRRKEVMKACNISPATLFRRVRDGTFPRPIQITERTIGWKESLIKEWIDTREEAPV